MARTTLALVGDLMLGRLVNDSLKTMTPAEPWGNVLPLLHTADARIGNLECAITEHLRPWPGKVFNFRADPSAVSTLRAAGFDALSLANNHSLDFERQGLLDTLDHLDAAGIRHAGAGRDLLAAAAPVLFMAAGCRVALISATDNEPAFAATATEPGTHYLQVSTSKQTLAHVDALIAQARAAGAELVVFSNHWGPNMVDEPPKHFREFAHAVIELGADVYHGHSAHVCQGVEVYRGKPILYDCGDFIDDYAVDPWHRNDWSFLFIVDVAQGRLQRLTLVPVVLSVARVRRAGPAEAALICARMWRLSNELGTTLCNDDHSLIWQGAHDA